MGLLSSVRCAHPSPDEEEHGPQGRAGVLTVRGGQGTSTAGRCGMGRPPGGHAVLLLRLVLPYVRHLKGEDDKPLPPSKPRKQYKMAKEPRGDDGAPEKLKKAKEEKRLDQVSSEPAWGHQRTLGLALPAHTMAAELPARETQNLL